MKSRPGAVLPARHGTNEKGPEWPALFAYCFLLPVGLADFMGTDATVEKSSRQRVLLRNMPEKKPRLFKGAAS
jgi:hypothetical protein